MTTQKQIRQAFWTEFPDADRQKITDYSGKGKMYKTNTRVQFCDFVDYLQQNDIISGALAQRVTL